MGKSLTMRPREYLIASGGAALPNGWNLLFGEAIRRNCAPRRGWKSTGFFKLVKTVMKINLAYAAFCWGASMTE